MIDPDIIDDAIVLFQDSARRPDYVVNTGYPLGFDVEVLSFEVLERAWTQDHNATTREHVTTYIARHPEIFVIEELPCPETWSSMRLKADTIEDFQLLFKICREFGDSPFGWRQVSELLKKHRNWLRINSHIRQNRVPPEPGQAVRVS